MKKSDLTSNQLQIRQLILTTLTTAGWTANAAHVLFEKDQPVHAVIDMEYENTNDMILMMTYKPEQNKLFLGLVDISTSVAGQGLDIVYYLDEKLDVFLHEVTGFQDVISPKNFRTHLRQLLEKVEKLYAITTDDEVEKPLLLEQK